MATPITLYRLTSTYVGTRYTFSGPGLGIDSTPIPATLADGYTYSDGTEINNVMGIRGVKGDFVGPHIYGVWCEDANALIEAGILTIDK